MDLRKKAAFVLMLALIGFTTFAFADTSDNINPANNTIPTYHASTMNQADFLEAMRRGNVLFYYRLRNEEIHQAQKKEGYANTIAMRLGYQTANFYHFSGLVEFTNTSIIGHQLYNSGGFTSTNLSRYATTNDPYGTRVDQLFLEYNDLLKTDIKAGRQRIRLDNERFIGNAGWRQTEQVYDGASFYNTLFPHLNLFYAYISQVNRVWGPRGEGIYSNNTNDTHLLNGRYDIDHIGTVTLYDYAIHNADVPNFSTNSLGARFNLDMKWKEKYRILSTVEYAHQNSIANNPVNYSTFYTHLALGLGFQTAIGNMEMDLQQENLGGNDHKKIGAAFGTPLASLHNFQGWAEVFNTTPTTGVLDTYANLSINLTHFYDVKWQAIYHYFRRSAGSGTDGNEIDFEVGKDFNKYIGIYVDYANFISKNREFPHTERFWLTVKSSLT